MSEEKLAERYGYLWPLSQVNDLSIELACYRDPKTYQTGFKPEYHFRQAFKQMWPNFKWNDWMELMNWAWCTYRETGVMGHTRGSKTYGFSHFALLDYLAAPSITATTLTTTKFDALKSRMWGDLMRAYESCKIGSEAMDQIFKVTNSSNELKVMQRDARSEEKFMIQGVATDSGDKSAGKIRGQHADRRRIIVDEAQDVADAIFLAFDNASSSQDFKGALLTNPVEKISKFGDRVKPKNGWGSIHDTDLFWETDRGICVHLDGLQSPNMKAGRTVFPFLLTPEYVESIRSSNGEESLEWWMYIRGFFPPDGLVSRIWSSATIQLAEAGIDFDFTPEPCASLDAAFESDDCVFVLAKLGQRRGGKWCMCGKSSQVIKTKIGPDFPEKDYQIARECVQLCKDNGVKPENFIMDITGNARGVFAIMKMEWSPLIQGIYYGGAATERPLRLDDTLTAAEQVLFFVTELWFRASYLAREGMLCGISNLDKKTTEDLNSRRYTIKQVGERKLMVAESKIELKKRISRSCDHGDAYCQLGELMVRKGLLASIPLQGASRGWENMRRRAVKSSTRYSEKKEFSYH